MAEQLHARRHVDIEHVLPRFRVAVDVKVGGRGAEALRVVKGEIRAQGENRATPHRQSRLSPIRFCVMRIPDRWTRRHLRRRRCWPGLSR